MFVSLVGSGREKKPKPKPNWFNLELSFSAPIPTEQTVRNPQFAPVGEPNQVIAAEALLLLKPELKES
jgi:hypothetical protein